MIIRELFFKVEKTKVITEYPMAGSWLNKSWNAMMENLTAVKNQVVEYCMA